MLPSANFGVKCLAKMSKLSLVLARKFLPNFGKKIIIHIHFLLIQFLQSNSSFVSSPEPLGSQGELIVYPSSRRPSSVVRRPSSS